MQKLFLLLIAFSLTQYLAAQKNITFLGQKDYSQEGSSLWGYTAPDGHEWVLMGTTTGTSIVDIANPANPVQKFFISGTKSSWREMKTYGEHGYVSLDETPRGKADNGISSST